MPDEVVPPQIDPVPAPIEIDMSPKMWYTSLELWTAVVSIVAFIVQGIYGNIIIPADVQAAIVSLVLLIMRAIRPPKPIAWTKAHLEQLRAAIG